MHLHVILFLHCFHNCKKIVKISKSFQSKIFENLLRIFGDLRDINGAKASRKAQNVTDQQMVESADMMSVRL